MACVRNGFLRQKYGYFLKSKESLTKHIFITNLISNLSMNQTHFFYFCISDIFKLNERVIKRMQTKSPSRTSKTTFWIVTKIHFKYQENMSKLTTIPPENSGKYRFSEGYMLVNLLISSVIRQKGETQNGCFKKTRHATFSEKRTFFTPIRTRTYVCVSGGKKCSFFGKFGVLCFFETPVLRFAFLP